MQRSTSKADRFRAIYDNVYPILIRVTYRIAGTMEVAEEICQEAFIRFYERADTFPDADQAKYWLIRVAKNLALNAAKRATRERRAYERVFHEPRRELDNVLFLFVREIPLPATHEFGRTRASLQCLRGCWNVGGHPVKHGGISQPQLSVLRMMENA